MQRLFRFNAHYVVFLLLVAIAVAGRVGRVDWNFTPVAAVALFAGFYFHNRLIAGLVPLAALAISDFLEPAHSSVWVALTVWAAMLLPAMIGPWLRQSRDSAAALGRGLLAALAPATFFFVATNFAVWAVGPAVGTAVVYSGDLAGLVQCYLAALPFYLKMVAGDLFYMSVLFGGWAWATRGITVVAVAEQK